MPAPSHPAPSPGFATPDDAVRALCDRLRAVESESVTLDEAVGRVLAAGVRADRDGPACDVSAMDGYAVRLAELAQASLHVAGEAAMGQPPPVLPPGQTVRVFTGSPIPPGADAVIRREDVVEDGERIVLRPLNPPASAGLYIRRQGENLRAGEWIADDGVLLTPATIPALATFGATRLDVRRRVRVAIINTGNELLPPDAQPQPWQIRDADGPGLAASLSSFPWLDVRPPVRVADEYEAVRGLLAAALAESDAILLTGGVSAGQYDFVPDVIASLGGETIFHRLPLRPGRPLFGAVTPQQQAILGLPGNPVSVMVTARRFAWTVLGHVAGMRTPQPSATVVGLSNPDDATLPLWWFRLVRVTGDGTAELVPSRGSGDVVALARSDGFVELPPNATGAGPWPYYAW